MSSVWHVGPRAMRDIVTAPLQWQREHTLVGSMQGEKHGNYHYELCQCN